MHSILIVNIPAIEWVLTISCTSFQHWDLIRSNGELLHAHDHFALSTPTKFWYLFKLLSIVIIRVILDHYHPTYKLFKASISWPMFSEYIPGLEPFSSKTSCELVAREICVLHLDWFVKLFKLICKNIQIDL